MTKCTVIIPYYQQEPGILHRALKSVFAQSHQDFDVIVVDDASPSPVELDLESLSLEERARITVIKQPNAGPGGARNMGLDSCAGRQHLCGVSRFGRRVDPRPSEERGRRHVTFRCGLLLGLDQRAATSSITISDVSALSEITTVNRLSDEPPTRRNSRISPASC